MGFALAPSAALGGYRLESFETIPSTNAVALERAREGDEGRLWLVSPHQQAGRGRRGRAWSTPPGNLAATLLLRPDIAMKDAASLGFVAGLSLCDALAAIMPDRTARFELKWPNDVLADGSKLSGILLETTMLPGGAYALAVGIGVNVVSFPDDLPYPATSLYALGVGVDAEHLFLALSDAWLDNMRVWAEGRGLKSIRDKWLTRAAGLGAEVAVRVDGATHRGLFETIDEECRFVIRTDDGSARRIAAGDVYFGAAASAEPHPKAGN